MFERLKLKNFTAFESLDWRDHAAMNVVIGENDAGKSHLLKLLYVISRGLKAHEVNRSGPDPEDLGALLRRKLAWSFQPGYESEPFDFRRLVRLGNERVDVEFSFNGEECCVYFSSEMNEFDMIDSTFQDVDPPLGQAVFLPPKEVLTALSAIEVTRERQEIRGFDDTIYDLIKDFRAPLTMGQINPVLITIAARVNALLGGEIVQKGLDFVFKRGEEEFSLSQTAEGFKKIGVVSRLIKNRTIIPGSVLIVDEPESNLHPMAIIAFADILFDLSQAGVQVYAATHSYFFLRRMEQKARATGTRIPLVDLRRTEDRGVVASYHDLRDEIPEGNPIVGASLALLDEDLRLDWAE